jgi:uncharacterized protein YndB with AHSA1/START domain
MTTTVAIEPVRRTKAVSWPQDEAFRRFTAGFADWWPRATHSIGGRQTRTIGFECRVGGQIYEELLDGRCFQWGKVTAWDPPRRVAFTWHPSKDEATAQDVQVLFHPREQGTEVELTATGWEKLGARGPRERKGYNIGWGSVLDTYAGRWSPALPVFAAVSGIIVTWQKLTGKYQAAIDAAGGRIPGKSLKGGDGQ